MKRSMVTLILCFPFNRVHDKPYVELRDSDGRSDHDVADEVRELRDERECEGQ